MSKRAKGNLICWRVEKNGWFAPRRVIVEPHTLPGVFRLRAFEQWAVEYRFIRAVWPFQEVPKQEGLKLGFTYADLTAEFVADAVALVEASYNNWRDAPGFGGNVVFRGSAGYGWTNKANSLLP